MMDLTLLACAACGIAVIRNLPKSRSHWFGAAKRALARIEDHWLAELIGAASLFGLLWAGLLFGHAWGL